MGNFIKIVIISETGVTGDLTKPLCIDARLMQNFSRREEGYLQMLFLGKKCMWRLMQ